MSATSLAQVRQLPLLLTVEQASGVLGQDPSSTYRQIASGEFPLPILRVGRRKKVSRIQLEQFLAGELPTQGEAA